MPSEVADIADLTREEYEIVRRLVYQTCGINLGDKKMQLVRSRLGKLVRKGGFTSYRGYIEHVRSDKSGRELGTLLDAISTNTTHLFREKNHFDFLTKLLTGWVADKKWRAANQELRIWCAASSSGEEPFSIAMTTDDVLRNTGLRWRILATDISTRMLAKAQAATFSKESINTVPAAFRQKYLTASPTDRHSVVVVPELRSAVKFVRFNLMSETFPFRKGFQVVFCRNVMIYFDRETQQTLVNKFAKHMLPGGHLLVGHSESLNNIVHPLKYVMPTIYCK
ncbi:MAG: chemotaxis protein CheR [Phycisphaerales bacterium]|nr:chemotaxis protein CheR [Phycisphaerales bacterium]